MKIWLKYLIGIVLGVAAALIIPFENRTASDVLAFLTDISVRFGRYTILPVLFFSVTVAVCRLQVAKRTLQPTVLILIVTGASAVMLTVIGLVTALIAPLPRIPIPAGTMTDIAVIDVPSLVTRLFPYSGFEAFLDGVYLLPLFLFAGLAGAGCAVNTSESRPAITLFDSLSKLAYNVMSFFVDMMAIGMIAVACTWMLNTVSVFEAGVYTPVFILLTVNFILVVFVLYPVLTYFLCRGTRPLRILYASLCPVLVAFFSGDTNLVLPVALRHGAESDSISPVDVNRFVVAAACNGKRGKTPN